MKRIILAISMIVIIVSCKKTDTTNASVSLQTDIMNVAYGSDPLQNMDIYLPPNRSTTDTKVLVMIHGGGWSGGDKSDFNSFIDTVKQRLPNYAIFNLNYRLAGNANNFFPTQENDIKSAVEFIYSKRADYFISDKFALLGASAGAHLALLQGYKYTSPVRVKAIIDFFGPTDMTAMYNSPAMPGGDLAILNVMGTTPSLDSVLYATSSPINFVTPTAAPTLIMHGGVDNIVSISQSDSLFARLDSANVISSYVIYPTQSHGWTGPDLYDSFNRLQSFLNARLP